jgi:hypothetical protein
MNPFRRPERTVDDMDSINQNQPEENHEDLRGRKAIAKIKNTAWRWRGSR